MPRPITHWATASRRTSTSSTSATTWPASGRNIPSGPEGLFLKRGSDVATAGCSIAKVATSIRCCAAPFIWLFGTNGFLVLHALLMTLCFLCAYSFLCARSHPVSALVFACAFLFVSLVPIYLVQLAPDFFIFAVVLIGVLLLVLQGSRRRRSPRSQLDLWRTRWLLAPRSDVVAAVLLGIAHVREADQRPVDCAVAGVGPAPAPVGARGQDWRRLRRSWWSALFALNTAVTGEWNYQGGERQDLLPGRRRRLQARLSVPGRSEDVRHRRARQRGRSVRSRCCLRRDALLRSVSPQPGLLRGRPAHRLRRLFLPGHDGDPPVSAGDQRPRDVAMADAWRRRRRRPSRCCSTCRSPGRAVAVRSAIAISSAPTGFSCSWCRPCRPPWRAC